MNAVHRNNLVQGQFSELRRLLKQTLVDELELATAGREESPMLGSAYTLIGRQAHEIATLKEELTRAQEALNNADLTARLLMGVVGHACLPSQLPRFISDKLEDRARKLQDALKELEACSRQRDQLRAELEQAHLELQGRQGQVYQLEASNEKLWGIVNFLEHRLGVPRSSKTMEPDVKHEAAAGQKSK
jgi:hypothetical protein